MAEKRQALGRGLSALLKDPKTDIQSAEDQHADKVVGAIAEIEIDSIEENPFQPRTNFQQKALRELAESIKELGIIQPITVRKIEYGKYQLISGERRFRAAKEAGIRAIPAYIRIANDQAMLEMALVENIQRQELDAIEIALSYQRLIDECQLTQEALSKRVGKDRTTVTNYLRLLKLQPIIQAGIRDKIISMGHARALINIEDLDKQLELYEQIIAKQLSVREVEALAKQYKSGTESTSGTEKKASAPVLSPEQKAISEKLSGYFGHNVDLKVTPKGNGKITIPFHSEADLERITKLFGL